MLRVLFLAHLGRRERDDTDGADARERFVVGRRAEIERDVLRLHLRRVRDGEAVLRVGERSRTRLSSSRRARVRRVLRERGERVGDDGVRDARRGGTRGEVWEVSVRRTRTRLWMDTSRNGAGGV